MAMVTILIPSGQSNIKINGVRVRLPHDIYVRVPSADVEKVFDLLPAVEGGCAVTATGGCKSQTRVGDADVGKCSGGGTAESYIDQPFASGQPASAFTVPLLFGRRPLRDALAARLVDDAVAKGADPRS